MTDADRRRAITIYGQQEVVKDLIAARLERGGALHFEVADVARARPRRRRAARHATRTTAASTSSSATSIAGCDGFHGVCRAGDPGRR